MMHSPNGLQQVELTSEEKYGIWDDVDEDQEEAPGDKLSKQLMLVLHMVQQSEDRFFSNQEAVNYVFSKKESRQP